MTVGVDLGLRAGLADERIVRRHRAVVAQAQRLADVVVERLRLHAQAVVIRSVRTELLRVAADAIAIADRDVEVLVLAEEDAAGEIAAGLPRVGDEDLLHVAEHVALEEPARLPASSPSRRSSDTRRRRSRFCAKSGWTATKCSRSLPCPAAGGVLPGGGAAGVGDVQTGCGASTPLRMMRSAPLRSVTRIVFASAKAMPHGWNRPDATVTTRLPPCTSRTCGLVSRGGAGAACCARAEPAAGNTQRRTEYQDDGDQVIEEAFIYASVEMDGALSHQRQRMRFV